MFIQFEGLLAVVTLIRSLPCVHEFVSFQIIPLVECFLKKSSICRVSLLYVFLDVFSTNQTAYRHYHSSDIYMEFPRGVFFRGILPMQGVQIVVRNSDIDKASLLYGFFRDISMLRGEQTLFYNSHNGNVFLLCVFSYDWSTKHGERTLCHKNCIEKAFFLYVFFS